MNAPKLDRIPPYTRIGGSWYLSVKEISRILDVSPGAVSGAARQGKLKGGVKVAGKRGGRRYYVYRASDVIAYIHWMIGKRRTTGLTLGNAFKLLESGKYDTLIRMREQQNVMAKNGRWNLKGLAVTVPKTTSTAPRAAFNESFEAYINAHRGQVYEVDPKTSDLINHACEVLTASIAGSVEVTPKDFIGFAVRFTMSNYKPLLKE